MFNKNSFGMMRSLKLGRHGNAFLQLSEMEVALYAAYTVKSFDTVYTAYTVDPVYTVDMVKTVDMVYTVDMVPKFGNIIPKTKIYERVVIIVN